MRKDLVAQVAAIAIELAVGERLIAAYTLAGHAALRTALAEAVLHGLDLHVVPVGPESAEDAAVMRHVAVPVSGAFPDAHRRQMRWLQRSDMPLVDAIVGNAGEANLAARPGLNAGPLDTLVKVARLARREVIDESGRAACAARIDADADIAAWDPLFRVDDFPALVAVARAVRDVGVFGDHSLPRARVAFLERQTLCVGAVAQDDGIASCLGRAEYIRAQREPVIHRDRGIPFDAHPIAELAHGRPHPSSCGHNRGAVAIHWFYRAPI